MKHLKKPTLFAAVIAGLLFTGIAACGSAENKPAETIGDTIRPATPDTLTAPPDTANTRSIDTTAVPRPLKPGNTPARSTPAI